MPNYVRESPFFEIPPRTKGDIDFYTDFYITKFEENIYSIEMFYSFNLKNLIFVKHGDSGYMANYRITIAFYNEIDRNIYSKTWKRTITTDIYNESTADRVIVKRDIFDAEINPGTYRMTFKLEDLNSSRVSEGEWEEINFSNTDNELAIIDIGFFNYRNFMQKGLELDTIASIRYGSNHTRRAFRDSIEIFYRLSNIEDIIPVRYSIFTMNGRQVLNDSLRRSEVQDSGKVTFNIRNLNDSLYILCIEAFMNGDSTGICKKFGKYRTIFDLSGNFNYINNLIERFIPYKENTLKKLQIAKPGLEREKAWNKFWTQFDPTPGTENNEYLNEFRRRVTKANRLFGSGSFKGSRTDMGTVFICLGEPDIAYQYSQPGSRVIYEIWIYQKNFSSTFANRFVFKETSGFDLKGNYRLDNFTDMPRYFEYKP